MKDTRFIELVNLYVDRQISAEETAELEVEIQSNPRRRRVYQQYCHMHRATKMVYESFRAHADQPATGSVQPGSIAYFAQRRQRVRRNFWLSTFGGVAAAACAAFYFVRTDANASNPAATEAAATRMIAVAVKPAPAPAAKVVPADAVTVQRDYAALALSQPQPVRPVSLFDDGVFDAKQDLNADSHRVFPVKGKTDGHPATEFTAFQFQR